MLRKIEWTILVGLVLFIGFMWCAGCGTVNPVPSQPTAGGPEVKTFALRSVGTAPDGGDEVHNLGVSSWYDAGRGGGNANLYGDTFVAERLSGSVQTYPLDPNDQLAGRGWGRARITVRLEGSFVPGNGTVTEAMSQLADVPLSAGGSETVDVFQTIPPSPDCPDCTGGWTQPRFTYSWGCSSEYFSGNSNEVGYPYSFASCFVHVQGGTLISSNVQVGQLLNPDPHQPWQGEWYVEIGFDALITGDQSSSVLPDENGGGGGKG